MKYRKICMLLIGCMLLAGCGTAEQTATTETGSAASSTQQTTQTAQSDEPVTQEVFAMDTYMTVTAYGEHAQQGVEKAVEEIERLDALLSIGKETSEIAKLNETGSAVLSDDTAALVDEALELYQSTDGAYDITVLPLMELWGFTTQNYKMPTQQELSDTLKLVGADKLNWDTDSKTLTLGEGQSIDLGGIAKGYTSGRIMEIFAENGVTSGMVSLGGNVQLLGTKTDGSNWKVGIQDPNNSEEMLGVLETANRAVITSGGYERYFEQDGKTYHHILDPKDGQPAESGLISVTIVSENGTLADGLSTSLFVMGKEKALDYWRSHADEFDAILMEADGTVTVTDGIADSFTLSSGETPEIAARS